MSIISGSFSICLKENSCFLKSFYIFKISVGFCSKKYKIFFFLITLK